MAHKPMTQEDVKRNFASIKRIDPCAVSIIDSSTHVALYRFNGTTKAWERTDIDGPLFVYKRLDRPFHSLMIANRHSREDYIEPVTSRVQVEQRSPYIFFCRPDNVINGLWFYREADCTRIHGTLSRLITISSAGPSPGAAFPELPHHQPQVTVPAASELPDRPPPAYSEVSPKVSKPDSIDMSSMPLVLKKLMIRTPPEQPQISVPQSPTASTPGPIMKLLPQNKSLTSLANFSTVSNYGSEGGPILADDQSDSSLNNRSATEKAMLTKDQIAEAVVHLIQTDEDFLQKLHQAYADAMNKRLQASK